MNLWAIFLIGLTSGGLSCLAVQGGLLASIIANQKKDKTTSGSTAFDLLDWLPVTMFLITKLIAHVILGFFLGWLGARLELSIQATLLFQALAALFMVATAMNLLEVHPIFRYVLIQPPKFFTKIVRNTSKGKALFTPALLGLLSVLIPCGVTQSVEVLAITSANPIQGALLLGSFVLGTSPMFAVVGIATAKLSESFQKQFMKVAAILILFVAISSLNGVLTVLDSPFTFQHVAQAVDNWWNPKKSGTAIVTKNGVQQATILVDSTGYSPRHFTVKAGVPVELTIKSENAYSCATSFVFKAYNLRYQLGPNDTKVARFTPTEKGSYTYTCSMGMYSGTMEVI